MSDIMTALFFNNKHGMVVNNAKNKGVKPATNDVGNNVNRQCDLGKKK